MFTKQIEKQLLKNGAINGEIIQETGDTQNFNPVVKLFGGGSCTWLLSEIDPSDPDVAFGLCDLGFGSPELGRVSISELAALRFPPFGLPIERDMYWKADKTLNEYASEAREHGRINS